MSASLFTATVVACSVVVAVGCGVTKEVAADKGSAPQPAPVAPSFTPAAEAPASDAAPQAGGVGSGTGSAPAVASGSGSANTSGSADAGVGPADSEAFRLAALGDSITRSFNSNQLLVESQAISFATGASAPAGGSHYVRLRDDLALPKIAAENVAVSGARAEDLASQIDALGSFKPHYATILIGANDVCGWPEDHVDALAQYRDDVGAAVDALLSLSPDVRLTLIPTPDLNQVYEVLKDVPYCRLVWDLTHVCSGLLGADATGAERRAFHERWLSMNAAVQDVAARHPASVRYAGDLASAPLAREHLSSIDCFHPSAKGQAFLAAMSWDEAFARSALPLGP